MSQPGHAFQDLLVLQDRMNRLFEDATQRGGRKNVEPNNEFEQVDWYPAADVSESEDAYLISLDLPGIDRATLDVGLDENHLTVKGTRQLEATAQHRAERPHGRFGRTFTIPGSVDREKIAAEYKDGVLNLHLPKQRTQKARRIEIKVS